MFLCTLRVETRVAPLNLALETILGQLVAVATMPLGHPAHFGELVGSRIPPQAVQPIQTHEVGPAVLNSSEGSATPFAVPTLRQHRFESKYCASFANPRFDGFVRKTVAGRVNGDATDRTAEQRPVALPTEFAPRTGLQYKLVHYRLMPSAEEGWFLVKILGLR